MLYFTHPARMCATRNALHALKAHPDSKARSRQKIDLYSPIFV